MNNFGIVLKKGVLNTLDPQNGELQFATDTDEFLALVNGVPKPRANKIESRRYGISVGVGIPDNSSGEDGDWYVETGAAEHKDYFKIGTWVERPEGYTESHLLSSFSVKKDWGGFVTRDGSVKFNGTEYDSQTLTDNSIVVKHIADTALLNLQSPDGISTDGTDEMVPNYVPTLDGDVLDIKSLKNPDVLFYPPTTMPQIIGAIWNDGGIPKIVGSGLYLGEVRPNLVTYELDGSQFGRAVDVSSTRILVGSQVYADPDHGWEYTGAGWLFDRQSGDLIAKISPFHTSDSWVQGGWSVSLSEDRGVIGSNGYGSTNYPIAFSATVFDNDGTIIKHLSPIESTPDDWISFGESVCVYGNRIIVGSPGDPLQKAHVYDKNGESLFTIPRPDETTVFFGFTVSVGPTLMAVNDNNYKVDGKYTGKVWIYDLDGNFQFEMMAPEAQDGWSNWGSFGYEIVITENYLVMSCPNYNTTGAQYGQGAVFIYNLSGTLLDTITPDVSDTDSHEFGHGLDVDESETTVAISSWNGYTNGVKSGAAWTYDINSKILTPVEFPTNIYADVYGTDCGIHSGLMVVGSLNNYISPGSAGDDGGVYKFLV